MLRDDDATSVAAKPKTGLEVAVVLGIMVALFVPFYISAKRRGDLGDVRPRKIVGTFCEEQIASRRQFAKESFRYKRSGGAWILIGCPKGKWNARARKCRVGTHAYKVMARARGRSCPGGTKRISK